MLNQETRIAMDASTLLWVPIALLFLSAIVNAFVKQHARDACIMEFNGDQVLVLMKDGEALRGHLTVYPDSLEIDLSAPARIGESGFSADTSVVFKQRLDQLHCIYRLTPRKGSAGRAKWEAEVARLRHPSVWRRMRRTLRNMYNILRDAFSQSVGMLIGIAKAHSRTFSSVQTADARATEVSQTLLNALPNAYEPILEKYIGAFVAAQSANNTEVRTDVGVLQDYSLQYLVLRDVDCNGSLPPALREDCAPDMRADILYPRALCAVRGRAREIQTD
jgi:hypothetical protein